MTNREGQYVKCISHGKTSHKRAFIQWVLYAGTKLLMASTGYCKPTSLATRRVRCVSRSDWRPFGVGTRPCGCGI